jgi:CheY-like chemotaxis protein
MDRIILAIDDEPTNLEVLQGFLEMGQNSAHKLVKCMNGQEGYDFLVKNAEDVDLILLDRMMPVMSGVEFLKKIKEDKFLSQIPVIMQTASNVKEHLEEGFALGVTHYLVKPFSPVVLNSMVEAAINFYTKQRKLLSEVKRTSSIFKYVEKAEFIIKNLDDVEVMTSSLARLFPDPDRVILGISEMLTNAIEHGNIEITYDEKTQLNLTNSWREEVERRLVLPENKDKIVKVFYFRRKNEIILNIADQGNGFDFQKYLQFDPNRSTDNHGRGISYALNLSFDDLEYIGKGNEVNCKVNLN